MVAANVILLSPAGGLLAAHAMIFGRFMGWSIRRGLAEPLAPHAGVRAAARPGRPYVAAFVARLLAALAPFPAPILLRSASGFARTEEAVMLGAAGPAERARLARLSGPVHAADMAVYPGAALLVAASA